MSFRARLRRALCCLALALGLPPSSADNPRADSRPQDRALRQAFRPNTGRSAQTHAEPALQRNARQTGSRPRRAGVASVRPGRRALQRLSYSDLPGSRDALATPGRRGLNHAGRPGAGSRRTTDFVPYSSSFPARNANQPVASPSAAASDARGVHEGRRRLSQRSSTKRALWRVLCNHVRPVPPERCAIAK